MDIANNTIGITDKYPFTNFFFGMFFISVNVRGHKFVE